MAITLDEINQTLLEQNKSLDITAKSIVKFIEGEKSSRGDELEEKLEAARERKAVVRKSPQGFKAGVKQGLGDATGLGTVARWVSAALAGSFGGATLGTVAGLVGNYLARGAVWGSAALLIGKFGTQLMEKVFESLDPNDVLLDEDSKKKVSPVLIESLRNGMIAMIAGKRFGIATFFGTIVGNSVAKLFNLNDQEKINMFGFELPITAADFAKFGATIAMFFAPSLIMGAIRSSLSGVGIMAAMGMGGGPPGSDKGGKLKPSYIKKFGGAFVKRLPMAAMIGMVGTTLGAAIGGAMGDEELGNTIAMSANVLGLAAMFGPKGVLIAAGVMAALAIGNEIAQWMARTSQKNTKALQDEIDRQTKTMDEKIAEGKFNEAADAGLVALANQRKLQDMSKKGAHADSLKHLGSAMEEIGTKTGNSDMVKGALEKQYLALVDKPGMTKEARIAALGEIASKYAQFADGDVNTAVLMLNTSLAQRGKNLQTAGLEFLGPGGVMANMDAIAGAAMANPKLVSPNFDQYKDIFAKGRSEGVAQGRGPLKFMYNPNSGSDEDFRINRNKTGPAGVVAISQDDNSITNSGSVVYQGSAPTTDIHNGGSSFSHIGDGVR
jgi:hypothetical protein